MSWRVSFFGTESGILRSHNLECAIAKHRKTAIIIFLLWIVTHSKHGKPSDQPPTAARTVRGTKVGENSCRLSAAQSLSQYDRDCDHRRAVCDSLGAGLACVLL